MKHVQYASETEQIIPPEIALAITEYLNMQWPEYNRTPITMEHIEAAAKFYGVKIIETEIPLSNMTFMSGGQRVITCTKGQSDFQRKLVLVHELGHVVLDQTGMNKHLPDQHTEEYLCTALAIQSMIPLHLAIPFDNYMLGVVPKDFRGGFAGPSRFMPFAPEGMSRLDAWHWATVRANIFNTGMVSCQNRCNYDKNCLRCPYVTRFLKNK